MSRDMEAESLLHALLEGQDKTPEEREAELAKSRAETQKILVEVRKAEAEARAEEAHAVEAECDAATSTIVRRKAEDDEQRRRAMDVYHRRYIFDGAVSGAAVEKCINELTIWSRLEPKCDITIVFNSPGGEVIAGMALFDFIRSLSERGHFITTIAMGYAASMGGILLQAGDKRVMGKEAYILIHEIASGAIGKIGVLEDEVLICRKMCDRVVKIFVGRSNGKLTANKMRTNWTRKDWWIDSDEALKLGLVDEVGPGFDVEET